MNAVEYLLSYGLAGDFGRFRAPGPLECRRGARAVVRSHRGLEIAEVLRAATPRHAHFLPNTSVGQLLRLHVEQRSRGRVHLRLCFLGDGHQTENECDSTQRRRSSDTFAGSLHPTLLTRLPAPPRQRVPAA